MPERIGEIREKIEISKLCILIHPGFMFSESLTAAYRNKALEIKQNSESLMVVLTENPPGFKGIVNLYKGVGSFGNTDFVASILKGVLGRRLIFVQDFYDITIPEFSVKSWQRVMKLIKMRGYMLTQDVEIEIGGESKMKCVKNYKIPRSC